MQVLRAEPREDDALVVGQVAVGTSPAGHPRDLQPLGREDPPYLKVLAVEPARAGEVGLLLGDVSAARFRFGDEVLHVELP